MANGKLITAKEEAYIRANFQTMNCRDIAKKLGRSKGSIYTFCNRKCIAKRTGFGRYWNKTEWTPEMLDFLITNFNKLTNKEIAKGLGLKLTVVRMKCAHLGLKRMQMEYWTPEQVAFLKANYKKMGNVEIAAIFQKRFPKNKKWTHRHINKKMLYMGLKRTQKQVDAIIAKHCLPGGAMNTIRKYSASLNMHPSWIVQKIAWRNKPLQQEIKKNHPHDIELKKQQLLLNRELKKAI